MVKIPDLEKLIQDAELFDSAGKYFSRLLGCEVRCVGWTHHSSVWYIYHLESCRWGERIDQQSIRTPDELAKVEPYDV